MARRGGPQFIPRPPEWRPGSPAPWAHLDPAPTEDDVRHLLGGRSGALSPVQADGGRAHAVLVPLYPTDDGLHLVLTRRAWHLRNHRGEVAFPGGRADPGEDAIETALREAEEEVGLDVSTVEVVGELDHLSTVTGRAFVIPVVGLVPATPVLRPDPNEVDAVLLVPLRELYLPEVYREERWGPEGVDRSIHFFELYGDTVWGATAAMLRQALALLAGVDPGGYEDRDPTRYQPPGFLLDPGSGLV